MLCEMEGKRRYRFVLMNHHATLLLALDESSMRTVHLTSNFVEVLF